uniref:UDENN domain-containing protein n=1 Tax=Mesocestoides corti TaxID=53468 RepID=A0A5K3FFA8_MESCO
MTNLLSTYNILADPHLANYFNSPRIKKHLINSGLLTKSDEIIPESEYRNAVAKRLQMEAVVNIYIRAIIDKAVEIERNRQSALRQSQEDILRARRVRRVKAERRRKRELELYGALLEFDDDVDDFGSELNIDLHEDCLKCREAAELGSKMLPSERQSDSRSTNVKQRHQGSRFIKNTPPSESTQESQPDARNRGWKNDGPHSTFSSRTFTSDSRITEINRRGSKWEKKAETCLVQLKFLGVSPVIGASDHPRRVVVEQQLRRSYSIPVYRGALRPNDFLTFESRRNPGYPFSVVITVDGAPNTKILTCCEQSHQRGTRIGGTDGIFVFIDAKGAQACNRCRTSSESRRE